MNRFIGRSSWKMKKMFSVLLALMFIMGVLTACGGAAKSAAHSEGQTAANGSGNRTGGNPKGDGPSSSGADLVIDPSTAKIASMSIHITNNLLALGIKPAGSVIGGDVKDFLPHVKERLEGTVKYGVVADPDMEALLASKPDYIFIDSTYSGADLAKFEKIAPTISINLDEGTWRDHLKQIAGYFGREAEAESFIADYDAKAQRVSEKIKAKLGENAKVMAVRMTAKELRVMSTARPLGPILFKDLGLRMADGVDKISADEPYEVISKEVLPDFDADAIFVIVSSGNEAAANFAELEKNAVWQNLKAVKQKHVYVLDGQKWLDYSSLGQTMALDNAEQLFNK